MFHVTGTPALINSVPFRPRVAYTGELAPHHVGHGLVGAFLDAGRQLLRLPASVSRIQAVRSSSSSLSQGQPGRLLPQAADSQGLVTGVLAS